MRLEVFGVEGIGEVEQGDDLATLIVDALQRMGERLQDGDVLVVAQKVVSKAEGRVRALQDVQPSAEALRIAERNRGDARMVQCVLDESVRVLREDRVLIVETHHGYVCANAGVDRSNVPGEDCVTLLPVDCDASARSIRNTLTERTGAAGIGVIVSDSFGRPWRLGVHDVALGAAGLQPLLDLRGRADDFGHRLEATQVAVADELAGMAELVMGKAQRIPVAVIRGARLQGDGSGVELLRPHDQDLFR